jgi:hypothetical protein
MKNITVSRDNVEQWLEDLEYSNSDKNVITAIKQALAADVQGSVTVLPDGSAFALASFPLPNDHWLYRPHEYMPGAFDPVELPSPITTHADRERVTLAVRYAIRGATMCGKEMDFDPDALVQNAVYALCGPFGTVTQDTPPAAQPAPVQEPVATCKQHLQVEQLLNDMLDTLPYNSPEYWIGRIKEVLPLYTTPPAAQRQCNWPTCQSEEYQQSLAEQIKQELVTGAAQPAVPDATNRQVEILSDALAESRREVAALKAVQEPWGYGRMSWGEKMFLPTLPSVRDGGWIALYTTPPAAQPALPDPIHHTDLSEHPEYISGWNDCRAAMMEKQNG